MKRSKDPFKCGCVEDDWLFLRDAPFAGSKLAKCMGPGPSEAQQESSSIGSMGSGITVDGRNPAPVEEFMPLFTGFYTSQVVQDFFHQLYF